MKWLIELKIEKEKVVKFIGKQTDSNASFLFED